MLILFCLFSCLLLPTYLYSLLFLYLCLFISITVLDIHLNLFKFILLHWYLIDGLNNCMLTSHMLVLSVLISSKSKDLQCWFSRQTESFLYKRIIQYTFLISPVHSTFVYLQNQNYHHGININFAHIPLSLLIFI